MKLRATIFTKFSILLLASICGSVCSKKLQKTHEKLDNVKVEEQGADDVLVQLELRHDQFSVVDDVDRRQNDEDETKQVEQDSGRIDEAE